MRTLSPFRQLFISLIVLTSSSSFSFAEGVVSVTVDGNDVTVRGDDESNVIDISVADGATIIAGIGTDLLLDGEPTDLVVIDMELRDLNLFMHKGDDVIRVEKVVVSRHIDARLGQGHDRLEIGAATVGQHLSVREGTGEFADVLSVDGGTKIGRNLWVDLGDSPRDVGPQGDVIAVTNTYVGERMKLVSGIGGTTVLVRQCMVEMPTKIYSGDGHGHISVSDSTFNDNVTIASGPNDDYLELTGVIKARGNFRTFLGYGEDVQYLDLKGSLFEDWTVFNGGPDYDELYVATWGDYLWGAPEVLQFETIVE